MSESAQLTTLNNGFGALLTNVTRADLKDAEFKSHARSLWSEHRGLIAVRGDDLAAVTPEELMEWSEVFGNIDEQRMAARDHAMVGATPILRIGNITDDAGNRRASFAIVDPLKSADDIRYNPATRRPVWHTDSTFKPVPPIGSVFHCKQCPPTGGGTLFADSAAAFTALDAATQTRLSTLEAVCSLAHHDKKISLYSPAYKTLNPEQRRANPPNRVPLVLEHPVTGRPALYGLNSSTCAIVEKGTAISEAQMDVFDLEGIEDESVQILRDLLPHATSAQFTVHWQWQPGDIVAWDNRCTMHAATGFEHARYQREMWRLTLVQ
jgi:taurine dioxygenase